MVIDRTGGIVPGGSPRDLREALGGESIRQTARQDQEVAGQPTIQQDPDRVTLRNRLDMQLRATNNNFERVQSRIVSNQVVSEALTNIQVEIATLRFELGATGEEPMDLDMVSQTIASISQLSQNVRFDNIPLLSNFTAESMGLIRIEQGEAAAGGTVDVGRVLREASGRIEERLDEVREEDAVDRRHLQELEVELENVAAVANAVRLNDVEEIEENLQAAREEIPRTQGNINLTPDQVLELI